MNKFKKIVPIIFFMSILSSCHLYPKKTVNTKISLFTKPFPNQYSSLLEKNYLYSQKKIKKNFSIYFPLNQYYIPIKFIHELHESVSFLKKNPNFIIFITVNHNHYKNESNNALLNLKRIYSITNYLENHGIKNKQIHISLCQKNKYLYKFYNYKNSVKNRRVDIKFL
ncbi:hypothetical protein RJU59_01150 [Buchnera aphidicola (Kurisakia onigurumii)]|uniref:hypothetical protein n=1 Tax=Buchnera aphidicola TaxID=9 RepID=UPI0031B689D7